MNKIFCDVCGVETKEETCAVVRLTYSLYERRNRSKRYGGSRGDIDLCEKCRLISTKIKIGDSIALAIIDKIKQEVKND